MALFDLMRKYPDAPYNWNEFSCYNPPVDIIRLFESKWNWQYLYNSEVPIDIIREYNDKPWDYDILSSFRDMELVIANADIPFNLNYIDNSTEFTTANLHYAWNWNNIISRCNTLSLYIKETLAEFPHYGCIIDMELIVTNPQLKWKFNEINYVTIDFILANRDKQWYWFGLSEVLEPADVRKLPQIDWQGFSLSSLVKETDIEESDNFDYEMSSWRLSLEFIIAHPNYTYNWDDVSVTSDFVLANSTLPYNWNFFDNTRKHYDCLRHPRIPPELREKLLDRIAECESMEFLIDNADFAKYIKWHNAVSCDEQYPITSEFILANADKIDFSLL